MSGPPTKRRGRPRVTTPGPATSTAILTSHHQAPSPEQANRFAADLARFADADPFGEVDECPDCGATVTIRARGGGVQPGPSLMHESSCPVAAGLDVSELDRQWFEQHPLTNFYRRPIQPAEVIAMRLKGAEVEPGAFVIVTQYGPGLRSRRFIGVRAPEAAS
jgi:hypothetical protein